MRHFLDFERPIAELEGKIEELRHLSADSGLNIAEEVARAIEPALDIRVPVIAAIIGEGGSGGAIGLAAGNAVLMLEHAVYTVISPEGCASILWRDAKHAAEAAE